MTEHTRERILKKLRTALSDRQALPVVPSASWTDRLKEILKIKGLKQMLYAPGTPVGDAIKDAWSKEDEGLPALRAYDAAIETFKEELFTMDAGITGTRGGIAETGALILWPDEKEPRLISLVPGVHIAVLNADQIYENFAEAVEKGSWVDRMPANALLISGPSKTADIELVLAFGVHGPKELIVLVLS